MIARSPTRPSSGGTPVFFTQSIKRSTIIRRQHVPVDVADNLDVARLWRGVGPQLGNWRDRHLLRWQSLTYFKLAGAVMWLVWFPFSALADNQPAYLSVGSIAVAATTATIYLMLRVLPDSKGVDAATIFLTIVMVVLALGIALPMFFGSLECNRALWLFGWFGGAAFYSSMPFAATIALDEYPLSDR